MKKHVQRLTVLLAVAAGFLPAHAQGHYESFTVSTYVIQGTVQGLMNGNPDPARSWSILTRNFRIDKVYIEVMRNHTLVDEAGLVLLTEQAKWDPDIIRKIEGQLEAGKSVCVTWGFVRAMNGKGIEDICELEATGVTVPVRRFAFAGGPGAPFRGGRGRGARASQSAGTPPAPDPFEASRDILIPEIKYFNILTHDAWGDALGISPGGTTYPVVLSCDYSKGRLYVLTIPNDPADLYALPAAVLSVIRATVGSAEPIRIDSAPAQVALFRYDNNTSIVQNYLPTAAEVTVSVTGTATQIRNLLTGEDIVPAPSAGFGGFRGRGQAGPAPRTSFTFTVLPHSYMAFAVKEST